MPARNAVKQFVEGGVYHVYNRGVERRRIFMDDEDFLSFIEILRHFLSPSVPQDFRHPVTPITGFKPVRPRPLKNLSKEIELIGYCLMPNHFHLLIRQNTREAMTEFMRKLVITYSLYFNKRHDRVGHLFQGIYKAALVDTDELLLHTSRYIHLNPTLTKPFLNQYPYSSYPNFIGEKAEDWVKPEIVLDYFNKPENPLSKEFTSYRDFIENYDVEPEELLGKLVLED